MDLDQFSKLIAEDPHLAEPIAAAAGAAPRREFGLLTGAALVALMFPFMLSWRARSVLATPIVSLSARWA